jgi:predicted dienelactone hydrolase
VRRTTRNLVTIGALIGALTACSSGGTANTSGPTTAPATTTTTTLPSSYSVATREMTFVDDTRPTPTNRSYKGASTRSLRVRFYYPSSASTPAAVGAPFPLILFSHGFSGTPEGYAHLLRDLAKVGYVVAAPAYPVSNGAAPGGAAISDFGRQPKDASFVLDQILAEDKKTESWLHELVDADRIGAAGHSLGAMTTYGLVYNGCCRDARIKAAVVLSGVAAGLPGGKYFGKIDTPLLAIHGDHDQTLPYRLGLDAFNHANRPKFLVTIVGGKHSSEERGGNTRGQRALTQSMIDFFDYYLRGRQDALDALTRVGATAGLTRIVAKP